MYDFAKHSQKKHIILHYTDILYMIYIKYQVFSNIFFEFFFNNAIVRQGKDRI